MYYKNLPFFQFDNPYELENFLHKEGQEHRLYDILELMKFNSFNKRKRYEKKLKTICEWWNGIDNFEQLQPILFEGYTTAYILTFYLKKYLVEKEIKKLKEKLNEISVAN